MEGRRDEVGVEGRRGKVRRTEVGGRGQGEGMKWDA